MFFVLSKAAGLLASPSNVIVLVAVVGAILMGTRYARAGRVLASSGIVLLAIAGLSPLGTALMLPLEERFPPWRAAAGAPDGIIVLGGAIGFMRGEPSLHEAAERITVLAALARQFPRARIVFSGGNARVLTAGPSEAMLVTPILESFGIEPARVELEPASRSTYENALFTKALLEPKPGERWLLVTSATHMPRAVGCFRRVGFPVEPYPVDWRTNGPGDLFAPFATVAGGLSHIDGASREWIGLVAYWLTGRSSAFFPGP